MGPLKPGTLINGRFVIEALSASGGMGTVYRAHDRTTGSAVALKVLERTRSSEARRMHGEAELLKQLDDPGIVSYIGHGSTEQGQFYLVMEWLSGGPLSELLRRGPLSIENALSVGLCAAQALGAAHARGIIHRDVKPSNLMVVDSEPVRVKLVDFGIARPVDLSTFRKTTVGTPGYLAPEQARGGRRYDGRADVFSLGCVLFECLAGQPAFVADDVLALMAKIALEDPPPLAELRPEVPAAFSELLKRMLCKEPQDRPADGNAVLAELKRLSSVIRTGGRKSTPSPFELTTTTLTHHEQRVVSILLAAEAEQTLVGVGEAEVPDSLQSALSPFGAELRRLAGGALACVFSGALASDLAARAARSSLLVASLRPRAPVVVATGRAVTGGRLPVGEVIDRASAMLHAASQSTHEPRGVWLDEQTARLLPAGFALSARSGHWELIEEREELSPASRLLGRNTPFVGRAEELERLCAVLESCRSSRSTAALIVTAPAGYGKSRLLSEVVHRVQGSGFALWPIRADALGSGSSLALARKLVERALGLRGDTPAVDFQARLEHRARALLPAPDAERVLSFLAELTGTPLTDQQRPDLRAARRDVRLMASHIERAFLDWLVAEARLRPVLIVLEDLHWGDRASVRLLLEARGCLENGCLVLLGAARPEAFHALPELEARVERVELSPLSSEASRELVRQALGTDFDAETTRALVERAQGNAFHLEELIRSASAGAPESLPETVIAMADARLLGVEPEARRLLRAASVLGESFWVEGIADMLGDRGRLGELLGELERDELIERQSESSFPSLTQYRFRHALLREAAYASLTDLDRGVAHAAAGRFLEHAGERDPVVLARHFAVGGQPELAAKWYVAAARQALHGNDLEAAIELAKCGVESGASGALLGSLLVIAGEAHSWRGENVEAERSGSAGLPLLERGGAEWCWAAGATFMLRTQLGDVPGAMAVVQELALTSPLAGAVSEYVKGLSLAVVFLCYGGLYDVARGFMERAAVHPDSELDLGASAWREFARCYISSFCDGDSIGHLRHAELGANFAEQAGDRRGQAMFDVEQGIARAKLGDLGRAELVLRRAYDTAARTGLGLVSGMAELQLATVLGRAQRLVEAEALDCQAALRFADQQNHVFVGLARAHRAIVLSALGRANEAVAEARQALELFAMAPVFRSLGAAALSAALLARGDHEQALEAAQTAAAELSQAGGSAEGDSYVRLMLVRSLLAAGRREQAREAAASARTILLARADRISDLELRQSFLERVTEHAETLELARQLL